MILYCFSGGKIKLIYIVDMCVLCTYSNRRQFSEININ
jgi:hypothetical protein